MNTIVGVASIVSAAIGAAISYFITTGRERSQATMTQFSEYHQPDHHAARARAARFLDDAEGDVTFNTLWLNPETMGVYEDLWRVTYFWFGVLMLDRQKRLDRRLAAELFSYQYEYWQPRLQRLADATLAEHEGTDDLLPEWVPIMRTDFLPSLSKR